MDSSNNVIATADYSNTQYSHAYYVDASPATGDVFYGSKWHTWLVGGLGAGGAAFYALDVTSPTDSTSATQFSEANAQKIVIGEWTPGNSELCQRFGQLRHQHGPDVWKPGDPSLSQRSVGRYFR